MEGISAHNPPNIPKPGPICGRSHFCSKASHCGGDVSCICVADKWHGEFFSSSCKQPRLSFGIRRGTLEVDSTNATQSVYIINATLTGEGSTDPACPCNCTYVSKSCCNSPSGIVYEALGLKLGSLQAPSLNLTCNATTGGFQASNLTLDVRETPRELGPKRSEADALGSLTTDPIGTQDVYR